MINFPLNPSLNEEYSFSGKAWKWSGIAWEINTISQSTGFTGSQGPIGFTGSAGSQGGTGFTGSVGFTGSIGFTGSQGAGFTGSQGEVGFTGSQGVGFTGSQGAGFTGSQGADGEVGFTGSKGIDGAAAVGGSDTQIQFNDSGILGASGNLTFDKLTNTVTINGKLSTTETWNNGAAVFTHIKSNVTNTASATGSSLIDLQVDGVSKFKVDKTNGIVVPSGAKLTYGSLTNIAATDTGPFPLMNFTVASGLPLALRSSALSLGSTVQLSWSPGGAGQASEDLFVLRDAGNTFGQRNGVNAQTSRIYNTFTDASNYERAKIGWNTNVLEIGTENAGTGTLRTINLVGGNIGVNTASPAQKLSVVGGNVSIDRAQSFGVQHSGAFYPLIGLNTTNSRIFGDLGSNTGTRVALDGPGISLETSNNPIDFRNGSLGAQNAILTGAGRFGLGTTTPSAKLDLAETWNNVATTFTHIKSNVTNTASATGSSLMDLQVGGVSRFRVDKNEGIYFQTPTRAFNFSEPYGFQMTTGTVFDFCITTSAIARMDGSGWGVDALNFGRATGYQTKLQQDGSTLHVIAQRNGTNAQTSRVYNTFTDASNYERAKIGWNTNVLEIGTENAGTGTLRNINLVGGNVGIGAATPSAKLDVVGDIEINSNVNLNSEATTLATVTKTQVASFPLASFRSGKLIVQAYDTVTGEVQISELLVAHNGTIASGTEYGVVFTGASSIVIYDVDISAGNVRLMATRTTTNSTQYKISETLIVA